MPRECLNQHWHLACAQEAVVVVKTVTFWAAQQATYLDKFIFSNEGPKGMTNFFSAPIYIPSESL